MSQNNSTLHFNFLLKKKLKIFSAIVLLVQIISPLYPIIAYAAPVTSNQVGSNSALDPVGNKATRLQTQGSSGVDQSSGAFTYSYPLTIPEGRGGMSPKLTISYNSQNNDSEWFGYGWTMSIPYIDRTAKTGSDKLYSDPVFVSSLHGELISNDGYSYEQKIDDGSYTKYSFNGSSWQMKDRDGTVYYFGNTSSSIINDASSTTKIGRWYLTEVRDKFGNGIIYSYTKDSGTVYPSTISYTEHALAHPLNLITFYLEDKNDKTISYKYGFKIVDTKRVADFKVATNGKDNSYFSFNYTTGSNGVRSLLQSVEEKHLSTNSDWTTLPKTNFEYEKSDINFSGTISRSAGPYGSNVVIDTNGDGILDLYNPGDGYFPIDINGDYKKDLVQSDFSYDTYSGTGLINFLYNMGSSTFRNRNLTNIYVTPSNMMSLPSGLSAPSIRAKPLAQWWWAPTSAIVDINGDGFDDIVYNDGSNNVGINTTNNTFDYSHTSNLAFNVTNDQVADINGDGLVDKISKTYTSTSTIYNVYLNNGTGYEASSSFSYDAKIAQSNFDIGVRFTDVNNDGLIDVVRSYTSASTGGSCPVNQTKNEILLNTGVGFASTSVSLPGYLVEYPNCGAGNFTKEYDMNGDLTTDYDGATNNTAKQDVLKRVTSSLGAVSDASYTWSTKTGLNPTLPVPIYIIATTTDRLSLSDTKPHTVGYNFYDGQMYFDANSPRDHRFAGFGHVDVIDGNKKTTTYYHQGNSDDYTTGEKGDSFYNIGRSYRVDTFDLSNGTSTLVNKSLSLYKTYAYASSSFTYLDSQISNSYNSDGTYLSSGNNYVYDETKRLIKTAYDYGDIEPFISFASSTITDKGIDIITTQYQYSNTRPQRLVKQTSTDYTGNTISNVSYYYDNLPFGLVDKGAVTSVFNTVYNNDGTVNSTSTNQTVYDPTGNVTQTIDNLNHVTTIIYDNSYFFPIQKINALNDSTYFTYDPYTLNLLSTRGPDNITYVKETDGLGNTTRSYTIGSSSGISDDIKTAYIYIGGIYIYNRKIGDSGTEARSFQVYDSYGRLTQSKFETSEDVFYSQDTTYDANSNIISASLPYVASGYGFTLDTPSNGSTVYTYDGLGRIITKSSFGNTISYQYGARNLAVYDNDSTQHKKSYSYDARGNISQVKEYNGVDTYITNYNYTPSNKLSRITDANNNIRNFSYLSNGSLTYQEDSHAPTDATFTTYSYSYDSIGNLNTKIGSLGTTTYAYDSLNRPTSRVVSDLNAGSSTVTVSYTGCSNNYNSPCTINRSTSSTTLSYGSSGKLNSEALSMDGKTFTRSYLYDGFGNPTTITNPDNSKSVYTYTLDGKQASLSYVTPGNVTKNIVSNASFNSLGALSSLTFGNGVHMCNTYTSQSSDGTISPKLSKSAYVLNANDCSSGNTNQIELYKDEFTYKDNITPSSILSTYKDIVGTTQTKNDSFTYDNLARLTQVSTSYDGGSSSSDTLTYDPIGNITKENDVLYNYSKDGTQNVNAVTSIGGTHITYDAQGNRIQSGDNSFSWNPLNQMVSATTTNGTESYTYDENGERIKKVVKASSIINQKVVPTTATATISSFTQGDIFSYTPSGSSVYIATSTYNTLNALSLLDKPTLYTLVSDYYTSPFTSKFCATATSSSNRQNCILSTTNQLIANNINGRSTTTTATNGLVTDIIKISTGEYLIPSSYSGLATSSIATSDPAEFSVDSGTISSYNTFVSTGIVVPMAQYSNLPYVSSSTYSSLVSVGLTDTSKVKALLTLTGCTSFSSSCTTAEKVVFEKYYKDNNYILSDKALQEMWYVFSAQARLPGNSGEFTSTSTTLGDITVPSITGITTSSATSTYYSGLYFTNEYNSQIANEPRLQFFNTIPYFVTQSAFSELQQAGISQTTVENYESLVTDLLNIKTASSTEYMTAINEFIKNDKKVNISPNTLKELYLVILGAATIPNNINDYTNSSVFDLTSYLSVQSLYNNYYNSSLVASVSSGCIGGYVSPSVYGKCVIQTSTFTLPVASSSQVQYLLYVDAPNPTEPSLGVGESNYPRGTYSSGGTMPSRSSSFSTVISTDKFTESIDATPTIIKEKASSTDPVVILLESNNNYSGPQYAYQSQNVFLKAYVDTPRLTIASTTLMTSIAPDLVITTQATTSMSTSSLVSYYKLDETSGNASDSFGTNTLTNSNATYASSKINNGAVFNGSSVLTGSPVLSSGTTALTLSAWVYLNNVSGVKMLVQQGNDAQNGQVEILAVNNYFQIETRNNSGTVYYYVGPSNLSASTWYYVTAVWTGSYLQLYVNGSYVGQSATTGTFGNNLAFTLGKNNDVSPYQYFHNGKIDEVGIWSRALSSAEISQLYNSGSGLAYSYTGSTINLATSTYTAGIQNSISSYFGENYDSSNDILATSTASSSLPTFISQESYYEFASTTLRDAYDISQVFLSTSTPQCAADASTTACDKQARKTLFKQIIGNLSGFIPSDAATEEFWMVNNGLLTLPSATSSISSLYGSSHTILINGATTTVNVLLRSQLPQSLSTSTTTTTINLSLVPSGLLSDLQFNTLYSTSTFALATSTKIVSEDTYNELLNTPIRLSSDVNTVFSYALPFATSSCSGQSATSSCVISAQKTKVKDTISTLSGFVMSDSALEELYRVYINDISIVPMSTTDAVSTSTSQTIILPLSTQESFITFSTTTVGTTTALTSNSGGCSFGTSGATTSLCYINLPYINSPLTNLILSYDVSTSSIATSTVNSYLSYITQTNASTTEATSTPTFVTTVSTSTVNGQKTSSTKFTFDLTDLYKTYLDSASPSLILNPDANGTSTSIYTISNPTLSITRNVLVPKISYRKYSSTTSTTTYSQIVATTSLAAYYKLDETSGNASDSFGTNTFTNSNVTYASSKINNGAVFASNSNLSDTASGTLLIGANSDITFNVWVKTTQSTGNNFLLINTANSGSYSFSLAAAGISGNFQVDAHTSSNDYYSRSVNIGVNNGNWHMISGVIQPGSGVTLYFDGVALASNQYTVHQTTSFSTSAVSGAVNLGNTGFVGNFDELGIWSRALSSTEIGQLYNSGDGFQYPFQTVSTSYYQTDQINTTAPIPFDRSTISSFSTSTATTTIDLTNTPSLYLSTKFLSPVGKIASSNSTSYVTSDISTSSLSAYYKLDETSGNASDSFGANTLTNSNVTYTNGKINNGAVSASNSNLSVTASGNLLIPANSAITFNFWLKTTQTAGKNILLLNTANSGSYSVGIYAGGTNNFQVNAHTSSNDYYSRSVDMGQENGAWHMITGVVNPASGVNLYFDGVALASNQYAVHQTSSFSTSVVSGTMNLGNTLTGNIDEVGIWSRALSSAEISQLYNSSSGFQYPFQTTHQTTSSSTDIYAGDIIDTTYNPLPTPPTSQLSAITYPFLSATSSATSTLNTLTVSTTTQYTVYTPFGGSYAEDSRGTITNYLTFNGQLVGTYTYQIGQEASTGKVTYTLSNYLGTPVMQTDEHGDIIEAGMTDIFGNYVYRDQRNDNALHTKGYTSHEYDDTTNLIYAKARYLDTTMHSFLSVDPIIYNLPQSYLLDPQQQNSYSYARNNPVIYSDPSGKIINLGFAVGGAILGGIVGGAVAAYNHQNIWSGIGIGAATGGVAGLTFGASLAITSGAMSTWAAVTVSGGMSGMTAGMTNRALTGQQILNQKAITQDNAFGSLTSLAGYGASKLIGGVVQGLSSGGSNSTSNEISTARFTQTTISPNFSNNGSFSGTSVNDMISGLKNGSVSPSSLPVNYMEQGGFRLVDNNRSAYALKQAGIPESSWNWQEGGSDVVARIMQKLQKNQLTTSGIEDVIMTGGN